VPPPPISYLNERRECQPARGGTNYARREGEAHQRGIKERDEAHAKEETMTSKSEELLTKINEAVAAVNEAVAVVAKADAAFSDAAKTLNAAQTERQSRMKTVGLLLLEARKLHRKNVEGWKAFLAKVNLERSRAYDFMRIAGGKMTEDELRDGAAERQRKSRAAKKANGSAATNKPES
jgi:hypothetical protein